MRYFDHADDRISASLDQEIDTGVDVLRATQGRSGLQQHNDFRRVVFILLEPLDAVHQDIDHRRLVLSKLGRSHEGDVYSTLPADSCDGIIIRVEYRA